MKQTAIIILLLLLAEVSSAQFNKDGHSNMNKNEILNLSVNKKEKGYYSIMQVSLLLGNSQHTERVHFYPDYYGSSFSPVNNYPYTHTRLSVAPSLSLSNGYMFNAHWAAGAGVGFEIFDHHLFPLFAELRYTLWDNRISPFVTMKGGYAFGNFKAKHHEELYFNWSPYHLNDASLRHYGGIMLHPEIGVKVPLNEYNDLLITAAYRHQKTKSVVRKDYESNQFDEWEHSVELNRLSFGVAIMFR